ncbi:MAG: cysteine hydrolase family protein [Solirubrobacterales bacterium]
MAEAANTGTIDAPAIAVAGSRPYAWPYDGRLTTTGFALVVVTGTGPEGQTPPDVFAELTGSLRQQGVQVVWVACGGSPLPPAVQVGDLGVSAPTANGFLGSELDLVLRTHEIDRFAIAGWPFEVDVHSTLRRANDLGFECLVLEDACIPLEPELQESSISQILMSGGIFGAVGASSALIDALEAAKGGDRS